MITLPLLRAALAPLPKRARLDELYPHFAFAMEAGSINTPLREAAFLATAAHESDMFCALEEYATGEAYEGREDLGNTEGGDGVRFKGRGLFMLTGRENYGAYSLAAFGEAEILLDYPEIVAEPRYAAASAAWFWDRKGLNKLADQANFVGITKRVNGGLTHYDRRAALYLRLRRSLEN